MSVLLRRGYRRGLIRDLRSVLTINVVLLLLLVGTCLDVSLVYSAYKKRGWEDHELGAENRRIYIAGIHWNNEAILNEHWIPKVVELAKHLGPDNVFVSVQESGSWDRSKDALHELDRQLEGLGIGRSIILDETTHKDEVSKVPALSGWIRTPRDQTELRRIPYLSRLRNSVLKPLEELAHHGVYFDKILWINDVVFDVGSTTGALTLLNTRNGDYAAACALDFARPPGFYDTFALRDVEGHRPIMHTWPYFRSQGSRSAIKSGKPVPVASCWNGLVSMDATPFYNTTHPLRFRGIPDSLAEYHIEDSECCLIHLDNTQSRRKGVWLNPMVRVGYSLQAYHAVNPEACESWLSLSAILYGTWINRFRRWSTSAWLETLIVDHRLATWQARDDQNKEIGGACLINEMQVLIENGWAHV